jgi:endonuclease/exonuclease/phosphatase family metal-dependent hydrolase
MCPRRTLILPSVGICWTRFLEKGAGIGRTFSSLSPTLRIDYILASKDFSIVQFNRVEKIYSDHYMLVTDLKLPPRQR